MLISNTVSIYRIFMGSWKYTLFNILTCIVVYILFYLFRPDFQIPALIPSILGTALAFFIGFNNNQAYDRWWEARKIWGSIVNDSRTWARQSLYFPESETRSMRDTARQLARRHISFIYALKENLRKSTEEEYKQYLIPADAAFVQSYKNRADAILSLQTKDLAELYSSNVLDGFKFMEMNKCLTNFCDNMGKAERISNTVFPTTYNYYTKIFIWLFIVFITLVTAQNIGSWSILIGSLIGYVFLTTHKIGLSLLNPFDDIPSGLPLNSICRTIEINMLQTIGETNIPDPIESVRGEYIM